AAMAGNGGMFFSNLVMYFIILASAATLWQDGVRDIETAADAARALRPLAGEAAALLMALGLVGSGFLAVPILTGSASYAVCEALGRKQGLDCKPHQAPTFYALIVGSSLLALLINFVGVNPMQALF